MARARRLNNHYNRLNIEAPKITNLVHILCKSTIKDNKTVDEICPLKVEGWRDIDEFIINDAMSVWSWFLKVKLPIRWK